MAGPTKDRYKHCRCTLRKLWQLPRDNGTWQTVEPETPNAVLRCPAGCTEAHASPVEGLRREQQRQVARITQAARLGAAVSVEPGELAAIADPFAPRAVQARRREAK